MSARAADFSNSDADTDPPDRDATTLSFALRIFLAEMASH